MIVVGVDGSGPSLEALTWAVDYAQATGRRVQVISATPVPRERLGRDAADSGDPLRIGQLTLERLLRRSLDPEPGVGVGATAVPGPAVSVLLDAAETASLLVLGHRGTGGFPGLPLGSVSQQCVSHARCPVLVLRPHADEV